MRLHQGRNSGQTIVEVLIAVAVVGLVLTSVAAGLTYSVKNTAESRYKTVATVKAQEALEMYRRERNFLGWESFYGAVVNGATYCLNALPASTTEFTTLATGQCQTGQVVAGTEFQTEATIFLPNPQTVQVSVTVSWDESSQPRSVTVNQNFQQWQ